MSILPDLTPTARYAILRAAADGIKAALDEARDEADKWATQVQSPKFAHHHGTVFRSDRKPRVEFGPGLLEWCQNNAPHLILTRQEVPASSEKALMETRFQVVDGEVIDTETGEALEFAKFIPGGPGGLSYRANPVVRAHVEEVMGKMVDLLIEFVAEQTGS